MKLISNILVIVLIYIICCARTCTEENSIAEREKEAVLFELRDSIKQVFGNDFPDDQFLKAFEATAKQKLIDFSDYLKIASDSSSDERLRQQTVAMVGRLFISIEIDTRNWSKVYPGPDIYTLKQLLEESILKGMPSYIKPIRINVKTPLTWENDSTYRGTLSFYQQCIPFDSLSPSKSLPEMLVIDMYVLKKVKFFGEENLSVWEVRLGDVH